MNGNVRLSCPLCRSAESCGYFYTDKFREFYRCTVCDLIHVPPSQRLSSAAVRAEYDKHQNSPSDHGYRLFLSRLFIPVCERIQPGSLGLDFGSGPGPTLSVMFEEMGHTVNLFDPFYAPDKKVLQSCYDFITASEVVEHLHNPLSELALLWSILNPGGLMGIMTKLALDKVRFSTWHYKNDPTHICFFSFQTMEWLAEKLQAEFMPFGKDVFLFRKLSL